MKITIPPAALEAGARAIQDMRYGTHLYGSDDIARATFEAMVEAWPMKQHRAWDDVLGLGLILILPLTENPDE